MSIYYYKIYDRSLESNCLLPELIPCEAKSTIDIKVIIQNDISNEFRLPKRQIYCNKNTIKDKTFKTSIHETTRYYLVEFESKQKFLISKNEKKIIATLDCNDPGDRASLFNNIIPFVLFLNNQAVLHGCVVEVYGKCIGFLGHSGAGKSTLAAFFLSKKHHLVSDDIMILQAETNSINVSPGYPGIRLWNDSLEFFPEFSSVISAKNKKNSISLLNNQTSQFVGNSLPLRHLYVLNRNACHTSITPISGAKKYITLAHHSIGGKVIPELSDSKNKFDSLAKVANEIPVDNLSFMDGLNSLEKAYNMLLKEF